MSNTQMNPNYVATVPLDIIAQAVASYFGIDERKLFNRTRVRTSVERRFIYFALNYHFNKNKLSLKSVGEYCKLRFAIKEYDHATVLYGVKQSEIIMEQDKSFRDAYTSIKQDIQQWVNNQTDDPEFNNRKTELANRIMAAYSPEQLEEVLLAG